ncbi:MerR family transcriptional regulator [Sunxiuqinia elliptica]|uniref:B12 binding protein n=1 Tax=Sunxiuqinia elliptica TaxID=655355 RepID=A0A4R6GUG0_9BACT|nr:MerR family transcriptional regulator [Sunxiuqinia elliptica]TDN99082.1 B12 binding protein [Sunxiuqinia elliptica]TDO56522.1 B12 binding protein [Sunxiuqinia elliptica]
MNYYTIKDLETLSGIKAHTIRIWEKRYGLLEPLRTTTNIRYYSDEELRKLLNVSMLVKHGYKISKVSVFEDKQIQQEVLKLNEKSLSSEGIIDQLIVSMVNFDNHSFEGILAQEIERIGFEETFMTVVFPLFEKVGIYWQIGSVFPAQEHFVSNITRQLLIRESSRFSNHQASSTVLFYLREGELHELSLLFYQYLALKAGYKTLYLGQNVPFDDLLKLEGLQKVDRVFTAFINGIEPDELNDYIQQMNAAFKRKKVFVTGAQLSLHHPQLPSNFKVVADIRAFKKYFGTLGERVS